MKTYNGFEEINSFRLCCWLMSVQGLTLILGEGLAHCGGVQGPNSAAGWLILVANALAGIVPYSVEDPSEGRHIFTRQ